MPPRPILVLGPPRSGSSWVAQILSLTDGAEYIHEPDNEKTSLLGWLFKRELARFPRLPDSTPADAGSARDGQRSFRALFRCAFAGRFASLLSSSALTRRLLRTVDTEHFIQSKDGGGGAVEAPRTGVDGIVRLMAFVPSAARRLRIVKSVHSVLSPDWMARNFRAIPTIVTLRSPYAVIDSRRRLKMPDAVRSSAMSPGLQEEVIGKVLVASPATADPLEQMALQLAISYRVLEAAAMRWHWPVVAHEDLCTDPSTRFRAIFTTLSLPWSARVAEGISASNRAGDGYVPQRVASAEIDKWRARMTTAEIGTISRVLDRAGLSHWTA
jgi:hypothetical protein